jgi:curved DNA-binding protein CbpA
MQEINAAYDLLRDGLADAQRDRLGARPHPSGPPAPPPRPGHWLEPAVRRRLGRELLAVLDPGEAVLATADASTWDALDVRLAVTDQRLLWLRDDAISDRVRYHRWARVRSVEGAVRRRVRRVGELRVELEGGHRLAFGELAPERLEQLLQLVRPLVETGAEAAPGRPLPARATRRGPA